jgi:hypothetical protein
VLLVLLIAVCRPTNSIEWNLSHFPDRDHLFSASRFNLYTVVFPLLSWQLMILAVLLQSEE